MNIKRKKERHLSKHAALFFKTTRYLDCVIVENVLTFSERVVPKHESNVTKIISRGKHK